jgi:dihydroorotate dehydrogenase (NAD+) catalytic subunit
MLETRLCGIEMKSPVMLGSGTLGETANALIKALQMGAGAVVNRTIRYDNTKREKFSPTYYFGESYMLNADNNNVTPWSYWIENVSAVQRYGPLLISVSARRPDDCRMIIPAFENNDPPNGYEINFSCPHSAKLYGRIGYESVRKCLEYMREYTKKPIFLKLSLDDMDLAQLRALESSELIDGYVVSNSIGPGLKINIRTKKPVLGSTIGGVSGPAIKPLVLARIYELKKETNKPIIGVGGIETAEDVIEYIIGGCRAVQVYTAAHRKGLGIFGKINHDLELFLKESGEKLSDVIGSLKV